MAIGNAVQRGVTVYVFNEKNQQIFAVSAGYRPAEGDGLKGYTSGTLNVQRGYVIYTYNDKGQQISSQPAR